MMMFIFMGASATFAASPDARAAIVAQNTAVRSVDNTYLINTDFSAYDIGLKIQSVKEDDQWYYIDYSYNTVSIVDFVWKQVQESASMKVTKKELANKDLGLYVAEQLGQVADQKLAYLKEVQAIEKKNGMTQKIVATEYSGLIGQFLSTDEKKFDGYVPVKPPILAAGSDISLSNTTTVVATSVSTTVSQPAPALTQEEIQNLIAEAVRKLLAGNITTSTVATSTSTPDTTSASAVTLAPTVAKTTTPNTQADSSTSTQATPTQATSTQATPTPTQATPTPTQATSTTETTPAPTSSTPSSTSTPETTPTQTSTPAPEPTPAATTTP